MSKAPGARGRNPFAAGQEGAPRSEAPWSRSARAGRGATLQRQGPVPRRAMPPSHGEARVSPSPRLPPPALPPHHSERERSSRFPIYFYLVDHMLFNVKCSVEEEIFCNCRINRSSGGLRLNLVINFCKSQAHADNLQQPSNINENVPILIVSPSTRTHGAAPCRMHPLCIPGASKMLPGGTG